MKGPVKPSPVPRRKKWKVLGWTVALLFVYLAIDALYFGLGSFDDRTGHTEFYWAGLDDLNKEKRANGLLIGEQFPTFLDGPDGPYVFGDTCFIVDKSENLFKRVFKRTDSLQVSTGTSELPSFRVKLRNEYPMENDSFMAPQKLLAISDMEGNFTGFFSFLLSNGVVDQGGDWSFGNGSVVFNGDFMDRGNQVLPVLWFIYHLEGQAKSAGGSVHFILGNHEIMNLAGRASHSDHRYLEVAKKISGTKDWSKAVRYLYSGRSELGRWLRSKNIVEKIGDIIFVHGGLNTSHMEQRLTISELNTIARKYMGIPFEEMKGLQGRDLLVVGSSLNSPYWDRRLNFTWKIGLSYLMDGTWAIATKQKELDGILDFYGANRIVIGHSPIADISATYQNKVILLDVSHGVMMATGSTRGLLVEDGVCYGVDDLGNRWGLF